MRFVDREDAGRRLAKKLNSFKGASETLVLALPRGGVVTGRIVADELGLPLDIVVPRKIGAPDNEEYAIGAITEKGDAVWNESERLSVSWQYLDRKIKEEKEEAGRRLSAYRRGFPPRDLKDKTVIVVDDGIATGLTMRAAIATVKFEGAKHIIVAIPCAPKESVSELERIVDRVVAVLVPDLFAGAIGAYYDEFPQVEDGQVIQLMKKIL